METRNTMYARFLCAAVESLLWGQGSFSIQQLANHAKLKVTPSMRRRLRRWVDSNHLKASYVLGENGRGSRIVYSSPEKEFPF